MKTIGLIGGMSWESSAEYYKILNRRCKAINGGFSSAKCLLYSVDFAEVEALQHKEDWEALDRLMADAAKRLYNGGAELVILCTNTMHLCSDAIRQAVPIPFIHIADATGEVLKEKGLNKVALLGTKFTMEKDFYKKELLEQFGIETIIPSELERNIVHDIIYGELVLGEISNSSKKEYLKIIKRLQEEEGAQGVILGCTEIPLLINQSDVEIPIFDTMTIHAEKAVDLALE